MTRSRLRGTSSSARIWRITSCRRSSSSAIARLRSASRALDSSRTASAASCRLRSASATASAPLRCISPTASTCLRRSSPSTSRARSCSSATSSASARIRAASARFSSLDASVAALASSSERTSSARRRSSSSRACVSSCCRMRETHESNAFVSVRSSSYALSSLASSACLRRYTWSSRRMAATLSLTKPWSASHLGTGLGGSVWKGCSASTLASCSARSASRFVGRFSACSSKRPARGSAYFLRSSTRFCSIFLSSSTRSFGGPSGRFQLRALIGAAPSSAFSLRMATSSVGSGTRRGAGCVRLKGCGTVCLPMPPRPSESAIAASTSAAFFASAIACLRSSSSTRSRTCGSNLRTSSISSVCT
mmetsp:Transcript_24140/g.61048  ORF Transcript_24140/g.61048 Transcript_24140/m.61048 type:complete len:365 (+) Transcript_24140:1129-2223(+)